MDSSTSGDLGILTFLERTSSTLEPLLGRQKDAGGLARAADTTILDGFTDEE